MAEEETGRKKPRKSGGGKLNRSEIVQTRLSPKLRFFAEVMARHQRRTLSSFIENLIEETAEKYKLPVLITEKAQNDMYLQRKKKYKNLTVKEVMDRVWTPEDSDRFAFFAIFLPDLLTPEEARVWTVIRHTPYFWEHFEINVESKGGKVLDKELWPLMDYHGFILDHFREYWPLVTAIIEGTEPLEKLKAINLPAGKVIQKPEYFTDEIKKVNPSYED